jgi:hypothetical protein
MALERQDAASAITPAAPVQQSGGAAVAAVENQIAGVAREEAQGWGQVASIGTGMLRNQALKQAQDDAAQIVQYGADGKLIAPKDFNPTGFGGLVYSQTYMAAAQAHYKEAAIGDARNFASELVVKTPTDPAAVHGAMVEYNKTKIEAMPEGIRAQMGMHLEGVRAGAVTSAMAGRERENLAVLKAQADTSSSSWVDEYGAAKRAMANGTMSPEQKQLTEKNFEERWSNVEALLKQSGQSPSAIAKAKAENIDMANATAKGLEFMERAQNMSADYVGLDKLKQEAFKWARDPANSKAIPSYKLEQMIDGYISRGAATAAAIQQAADYGVQQTTAGLTLDNIKLDIALKTAAKDANGNPIGVEGFKRQQQEIYNRALQATQGKTPLQQAQILQAGAAGISVVQQAYGAALTSAVTGYDTSKRPMERNLYENQIRAFVSDPYVAAASTSSPQMASLVSQANRTLARADVATASGDAAIMLSKLQNPNGMSLVSFQALSAEGMRTGHIGPTSANPIQTETWVTQGAAAVARYEAKNDSRMLAQNAISATRGENGQRQRLMTEAEQTAVTDNVPLRLHSLDFANGQHVQELANYTARTGGVIPTEAKRAFSDLRDTDDPRMWAAATSYFDGVRKVYRDTLAKSAVDPNAPGGKPSEDFINARSYDVLRANMGEESFARAMAWKRTGIATKPGDIAKGIEGSTPGRNDGGPDLKERAVGFLLDRTKDAVQNGGTFNSILNAGFRSLAGGMLDLDQKFNFKAWSNADTRAVLYPLIERSGLAHVSYDDSKTTITATAADMISEHAIANTRINGEQLRADGVKNPLESNTYLAIKKLSDNGTIGLVKNAAGGLELAVRPATSEFNRLQKTNWTQPEVEKLAFAQARNTNPDLYGMVEPSTLKLSPRMSPDGNVGYAVVGLDKNSATRIIVGSFDPASVDFGRMRLDLAKTIDKEINKDVMAPLMGIPLGGGALVRSILEAGKKDEILTLAKGDALSASQWQGLIGVMKEKNPAAMSEESWKTVADPAMQETISKYGSTYAMLFGYSSTKDVASLHKNLDVYKMGPVTGPDLPTRDDQETLLARGARDARAAAVADQAARREARPAPNANPTPIAPTSLPMPKTSLPMPKTSLPMPKADK